MPRYTFVLSKEEHDYLAGLAKALHKDKHERSMSELVREGIRHLKVAYSSYETKKGSYVTPEKEKELV